MFACYSNNSVEMSIGNDEHPWLQIQEPRASAAEALGVSQTSDPSYRSERRLDGRGSPQWALRALGLNYAVLKDIILWKPYCGPTLSLLLRLKLDRIHHADVPRVHDWSNLPTKSWRAMPACVVSKMQTRIHNSPSPTRCGGKPRFIGVADKEFDRPTRGFLFC